MMPGETHSKTAGIASEAAGSCQNCTSLQQSLNEYVSALIALKQKIIDSDQLLAEYQQKCDDLQYAERENETIKCQLEQMLQKMAPHEQNEEKLRSLKADLEEKTATLQVYQQIQMEYIKVKEECEKSDISKKKLEAKLKKMEEAATKHDTEYKQLKMEKKVIGKELEKMQKKLEGFQTEKKKKVVMKNAQTQVAREEPVVKLDKKKIKYLLKEIWGCIEPSTENGDCNLMILDKRKRKNRNSLKCKLPLSPSSLEINRTWDLLTELSTVQESLNLTEPNYSPRTESAVVVSPFIEDATVNVLVSKDLSDCSSVNSDFESEMDEILKVQDWAKPLPHLLSPIHCSPLTVKNVFGEFTDTSDAESTSEMDQSNCSSQLETENILKNGTDKNTNVTKEIEHILVASDNFAVITTVCYNDGQDLTMEMETKIHDLQQSARILPLQEARAVTEDPIHMEYEDRSDDLKNSTACYQESLTGAWSPESKFQNLEFGERASAEMKNVAKTLDTENEKPETACQMEEQKMQLDRVRKTSVHLVEPNDTVGKIEFDNITDNNETIGCLITNRSLLTKDPLVHNLNLDRVMLISVDTSNAAILDCDQETMLHMQPENCPENENSSSLHAIQNTSDNVSTLSKVAHWHKCFNDSVDTDLSKCSEENVAKTLDTMPTLNKYTEETEQSCSISTENIYSESILKSQSQQSQSLRQTSPLLFVNNCRSPVTDCKAHGIDCETIKENSTCDKSEDTDKKHKAYHEVVVSTTDKQNIMAVTLNKSDSISIISMGSECKTVAKDGLGNSLQKEKILDHETKQQNCCDLGMDKMASTSLIHGEDNPYECSSPETDDHSSSVLGLKEPLTSTVDLKSETDTCNEDYAYSPKLVICDDHLSPPPSVHLNDKCTSRIDKCTDNPSLECEKHNRKDFILPSVVNFSPDHMEVDSEHRNDGTLIKTQCQEVAQSIESSTHLKSSLSKDGKTILCPLSTTSLIPEKAKSASKVLSPVPLEELQRLHITSESNDYVKKIERDDTTDTCDVSLDSSESEYEFVVRKVNFTRPTLNSPVVRNESFRTAYDATKSDHDNALLIITETEQHKPTLVIDESKGHVATAIKTLSDLNNSKVENDILIEHEHSLLQTLDTDSKNSVNSEENVVECPLDGQSKDISDLQEPVRQNNASDNVHSDNHAEEIVRNYPEARGQRMLPGKNFIWNFSRSEDFVDSRAICLIQKTKTSSENVCGNLENSVRSFVGTGKMQEYDTSNKPKPSSFPTVRKENPPCELSQGDTVSLNGQIGQTVLANADTSSNTGHSPETINKVRSEMGPPLPPLLGPLLSTPPRSVHTLSPIMSSSSRSSLPSPLDELISPVLGTQFPPLMSPLCDGRKRKSPVFNTPSPAEKTNLRILSSPLQFCAATPKHAVPVPGRLPLSANGGSACTVQENSVKILDTMYPELSARARTLNILKGNVQLNRGISGDGQNLPVSQITGFKSITSTSTVFIKTVSNSKTSNKEKPNACESEISERCTSVNKRAMDCFQMPKSAKRLRLDSESPIAESVKDCFTMPARNVEAQKVDESCQNFSYCVSLPDIVKDSSVDEDVINLALKKVEELCFDLLPVIRSHVHVGTIPNVPVMRNEEKEVIYDFSSLKKGLADRFLHVLLKKIKTGKRSLDGAYLQALCRVYVGLCRQLGDIERARILCYSILKEDFPDPDKLLLFVISSWNDILSLHGVVSKAIQAVLKNLANDDVCSCLGAYLNWEKSPPMNLSVLLNSVLMAIQLYPDVKFHQSEKYGEDLTDNVWEYVFAVDLLCSHRKWIWTHENVISKELWPILDKWVKRKKGNLTLQCVPDIIVATVLRLIGHLCQMGLKEGFITAVKNITSVILAFINHANEEGVPWGVQLASVYMLCDTAPCDPALVHKTLQAWKETTVNNVPPAVINCMQEIASLCAQDK